MGCKPSTTANADTAVEGDNDNSADVLAERYRNNLVGVGQTERQLSKMQRAAMNNSSRDTLDTRRKPQATGPKLDASGFLVAEEVAKRTCSSICNKEVTLGSHGHTTHVQFAYWTQRGYYPEDPNKQNQDEFGTHLQFAGVDDDAMFAVYDGHGRYGHTCSKFAKDRLPKAVAKHVRRTRCQNYKKSRESSNQKELWDPSKWPMLDQEEYEMCCQKAFQEVNQAMHDDPDVLDNFSGTTATTVTFHGDFMTVSNVGDSRVVLGHRVKDNGGNSIAVNSPGISRRADSPALEEEKNDIDDELDQETLYEKMAVSSPMRPPRNFDLPRPHPKGTKVLAVPLSKDQTPYRKDERERVKKAGASIMTVDQMQGKEEMHDNWGDFTPDDTLRVQGDSPRLWVEGKDYPGCAFTRSLGDCVSESIGVHAIPEVLSTSLTMNDEYLVIASDGVFEFLTNQAVIELCAESESPLIACEKIVKLSYHQWIHNEKRSDDITIIVCFLRNFNIPPPDGNQGTSEDLVQAVATVYGHGPESMKVKKPPIITVPTFNSLKRTPPSSPTEDIVKLTGAVAYVSEEAQTEIVHQPPPPPEPMTLDNSEIGEVKFDALMEEVKCMNNGMTKKTVSVYSREGDYPINESDQTEGGALKGNMRASPTTAPRQNVHL